jgi:[protein-PII] uridylyltransferase
VSWLAVERIAGDPTPRTPAPHDAVSVLVSLADAADAGEVPSSALLDAIEMADVPDPVRWDPSMRGAFLRLLRAGDAGAAMMDVLDRVGLLSRYVPAWKAVRCRPQRDPYHRSTVDAHLVSTARRMAEMLDDRRIGDDPIEAAAVAHAGETDALLLGALLHDVGKIGAGGHVEIGTGIAHEMLGSIGIDGPAADLAEFMVAEHLLLPDTATRRDLSDEELLVDVAARIGTPERLEALYLLAKADAMATGPAAWSPWRQTLIRELVTKVLRVFERGQMGQELAVQLAERTEHVRDLLRDEPERDVDRFILRMPRGYLLSTDPARAAEHARLIASPVGSREVRSAASEVSPGTYEVVVVATDRPGLLSWIAGGLALEGVSILSAQAFTTDDGVALDVFQVQGAFEPEITERRWRAFRTTLRRTIEGSISLEHRVEEKRRHYPSPKVATPVTVRAHNDVSEFSTVIEVGAPDRIGLLFDITRTFAELHLDVHLAKVATFEGRVVDAFYVRDALGRKVVDPDRVSEIAGSLHARLMP